MLTPVQRDRLAQWLPGAAVLRDHSWGLVQTRVLEVAGGGSRYIVKAAAEQDHHLAREVRAHREWLHPWTSTGRAPALEHADLDAKILVTRYLPGDLVLGTLHADEADTYRQAGELLGLLHHQSKVLDVNYEARENRKSLSWLDRPHRITPSIQQRLRSEIASWAAPPVTLVPTHGDWHPRNWLVHGPQIRAIDFGRAAMRPAMSDVARLSVQEFRGRPELESAFLDGYGSDPREVQAWRRQSVREAISTAVWAHQVGDEAFEAQGHTMIAEALASIPTRP